MLISAEHAKMIRKMMNTLVRLYPSSHDWLNVPMVRSRNVAAPYATDARMAMRPMRLSHPV